ncbi:MAG: leucyl/phenylalanyl-tRNA--protein transferase [Treponema sp.]|jgi:leucyl/phenylalanyl-tRNA--protein transferase|nr:leucyl/phenylalanyl-tRNA--protein transferase [Treponema sp.]
MKFTPGPDPDFPRLGETDRYPFPPPQEWKGNIVAVGGNLSPGMLLSAYEQGLFPWYNPAEDPLLWQSPDPRMVILPGNLHVSRSMKKIFENGEFEITINGNFPAVIAGCAETFRPGQGGTWICADIVAAYTELHRMGWVISAEAYQDGELAGGCYGVRMGRVFCGESMFARKANASKAAFLALAQVLFADGVAFIDCQVPSNHLRSLGGTEIRREEFLKLLAQAGKGGGHER